MIRTIERSAVPDRIRDQSWRGSLNATYPGSFIALIPDHIHPSTSLAHVCDQGSAPSKRVDADPVELIF